MDAYTVKVKNNIDKRFLAAENGIYMAHQPIYGYRSAHSATSNIAKYMVTRSILNNLNRYSFSNVADIGGAEGYTSFIVKKLFNVPVTMTDLSETACANARNIFRLEATPCDIHSLPFSDGHFDTTICSETIEHVTDYKKAVDELLRITKNVLIITVPHESEEMVADTVRKGIVHGHIHYFDTKSFDYLKERGYVVKYEKILSPLLILPRVMAEAFKKEQRKFHYKLYNLLTPVFRRMFTIRTANRLINWDAKISGLFGLYNGVTFIIEKQMARPVIRRSTIKAEDFTGISVPYYYIKAFDNKELKMEHSKYVSEVVI